MGRLSFILVGNFTIYKHSTSNRVFDRVKTGGTATRFVKLFDINKDIY